jgi:Lon protease-like protein
MATVPDFPLFPLRLVALPTELVPLHIFEDRYQDMVARCIEEPTEFGIICAGEDGVADVGCACEIAEVLERFEDGRVNLVARGTRPFEVEVAHEQFTYPAGTVRFLDDVDDVRVDQLWVDTHEAYAELVRQATDRDPDLAEINAMTAYQMAATVEFSVEAKQQLLEERSETARMEQLLRLLRAAVRKLDYMERAQARAASNGKVRLGPDAIPPPSDLP